MLGLFKPKGILVHTLPIWVASKSQGFHIIQNAVAAQNSYAGVLNGSGNDTLYCFGVTLYVSVNTYVFVELIKGNPGSVYSDGAAIVTTPIDPRIGQISATPWNYSVGQCIGNHVGGFTAYTSVPNSFFPGFPIAIAPPGWSVALQLAGQNVTMETTIYVAPVKLG